MNRWILFLAGLVLGLVMMILYITNNKPLEMQGNEKSNYNAGLAISLLANTYPENGYVPNEETAIAIAEAVIIPIYGKRKMKRERPYKAKLKNNEIWIVWGSIPYQWIGIMGGSIEVQISKRDGRILKVYHSR